MANEIAKLKNYLGVGARPNKYRLVLNFPSGVMCSYSNGEVFSVLCRECDGFPEAVNDTSSVFSQGRKLILPKQSDNGGTWKATFYNEENHAMRNSFMSWAKAIDNIPANTSTGDINSVFTDIRVEQLDSANNVTAACTLRECFVTNVSAINFNGSSAGDVETFDVTWNYSYFTFGINSTADVNDVLDYNNATRNSIASDE